MNNATQQIIKDGQIVDDHWQVLRLEDLSPDSCPLTPDSIIVPLSVWQAQYATLSQRGNVGVWLASSERAESLKADIPHLPIIAIDFPKFSDGRGYSIAYHLRARLNYRGELRAIGDVLRDQLFYMQRVGFNAFAVRADRNIHDALAGLNDFSISYQTSIDQPLPLFRRTARLTP
jgi:uncharacterized protein (DUF934 family)